jgi:hypothetical protein
MGEKWGTSRSHANAIYTVVLGLYATQPPQPTRSAVQFEPSGKLSRACMSFSTYRFTTAAREREGGAATALQHSMGAQRHGTVQHSPAWKRGRDPVHWRQQAAATPSALASSTAGARHAPFIRSNLSGW